MDAPKNVNFVENVSNVQKFRILKGALGLIQASKEDFGISVVEAQALGIPVLAYDEGGARETVLDVNKSNKLTGLLFKYQNEGASTLEDGLYVLEKNLGDSNFKDKMVRFVRASMKGWKYAEANPKEAASIILDNDDAGVQTEKHQVRMMGEIAKLTAGSNGSLDPSDYQRTVEVLMSGASDPVITKEPAGAWTHDITNAALK